VEVEEETLIGRHQANQMDKRAKVQQVSGNSIVVQVSTLTYVIAINE
jgi:hypothetical protein